MNRIEQAEADYRQSKARRALDDAILADLERRDCPELWTPVECLQQIGVDGQAITRLLEERDRQMQRADRAERRYRSVRNNGILLGLVLGAACWALLLKVVL